MFSTTGTCTAQLEQHLTCLTTYYDAQTGRSHMRLCILAVLHMLTLNKSLEGLGSLTPDPMNPAHQAMIWNLELVEIAQLSRINLSTSTCLSLHQMLARQQCFISQSPCPPSLCITVPSKKLAGFIASYRLWNQRRCSHASPLSGVCISYFPCNAVLCCSGLSWGWIS